MEYENRDKVKEKASAMQNHNGSNSLGKYTILMFVHISSIVMHKVTIYGFTFSHLLHAVFEATRGKTRNVHFFVNFWLLLVSPPPPPPPPLEEMRMFSTKKRYNIKKKIRESPE